MSISVKSLVDEVRQYANQSQSLYFSPEEMTTAINRAQTDKYRSDYSIFESNQMITDSMRNFKRTVDIPIGLDSLFPIPDDYYNVTNLSSLLADPLSTPENPLPDKEYSGKVFTDGEFLDAAESELLPPENEFPKARIINSNIQILPQTVTKIRLYYLSQPVDVVYAYDLVGDKIIFKDQGSVDSDYPNSESSDIIARTLVYLGITMREEILVGAEKIINS